MRADFKQVCQVVHLLVEGLGIRAVCRLAGLNKQTVLHILAAAGERCAELLDQKILNVKPEPWEIDECWTFVKNKRALKNEIDAGDFYGFFASGKISKLIISHAVGKRTYDVARDFMGDIRVRVAGPFQITSDGWKGFIRGVLDNARHKAHYATQNKKFAGYNYPIVESQRRYSPGKCVGVTTRTICGHPDPANITTSHAERLNLSVRHFNKRFTRLTPCFSRKVENLAHSVALNVAHFNFCRVHSAHNQTPAQAAGLTNHAWTLDELLTATI